MAHLVPAPLEKLVRRMLREAREEGKVFDVPARRFWRGAREVDMSVVIHGLRVANPSGPAAGPHGQMAQNILSSWIVGGRFIELKTIQRNDRLTIPRPCIDMETVGYNVEWSQELSLGESLREYVKGSMLIDIARAEGLLGRADDPLHDEPVLDMSVGYDLAGVRSAPVRAFVASMKDARAEVEALRSELPGELRGICFRTALSDQVTLSTFHGCPADEIEAMAVFLMEQMGLHVTVKLNPTLLGKAEVDGLLHDVLGYREIETRATDFEKDLQWSAALEMADRLSERARALGRELRVKLSNTLVVRNHRHVFPASEEAMYLSGPPLHVIALSLAQRLRRARPGLALSFSAGVDNRNFADCVAAGFAPVTACTDLLKPGGYSRLTKYLENLEQRMLEAGARSVAEYVGTVGMEGAVSRDLADPRYRADAQRPPRRIGRHLSLFDCTNCDKCLPACPNDANFVFETEPLSVPTTVHRFDGVRLLALEGAPFLVRERHQIGTFQDFCNECGNCDTFCPEDGGPYKEKPRFFGSLQAWKSATLDGFCVMEEPERQVMWGRIRGLEYRLEVDRKADRADFTDGRIRLELSYSARAVSAQSVETGTPVGHTLDGGAWLTMATLLDGVSDRDRTNPLNA